MLKPTLLFASVAAALFSINANAYDPEGFNECVLDFVTKAHTDYAVAEVMNACSRKHSTDSRGRPRTEENRDDANIKVAIHWSQVSESDEFLMSDRKTRDLLRKKYLEWVIIPEIRDSEEKNVLDAVRAEFMERTQSDLDRSVHDNPD